MELIYKVILV